MVISIYTPKVIKTLKNSCRHSSMVSKLFLQIIKSKECLSCLTSMYLLRAPGYLKLHITTIIWFINLILYQNTLQFTTPVRVQWNCKRNQVWDLSSASIYEATLNNGIIIWFNIAVIYNSKKCRDMLLQRPTINFSCQLKHVYSNSIYFLSQDLCDQFQY